MPPGLAVKSYSIQDLVLAPSPAEFSVESVGGLLAHTVPKVPLLKYVWNFRDILSECPLLASSLFCSLGSVPWPCNLSACKVSPAEWRRRPTTFEYVAFRFPQLSQLDGILQNISASKPLPTDRVLWGFLPHGVILANDSAADSLRIELKKISQFPGKGERSPCRSRDRRSSREIFNVNV